MTHWIQNLAACTVLFYNLLLGNHYLGVNQATPAQVHQPIAQLVAYNLSSAEKPPKQKKEEGFQRFSETIEGAKKLEGLFSLYRRPSDGKIYLEIKPEQLNKNYLGTVTIESGIGERGLYSGQALQDFLFYFRQVNDRVHFVLRNVKFRTNPGDPAQRSIARSFSDSVLYSLPILSIHPRSKVLLVDLGDLLMEDFPGLTSLLESSLHANYRLETDKSYFGNVSSFPFNLDIESVYNFSSEEGAYLVSVPDTRALTLKVHYSFSQLPKNNGYIPRIADDRVGYFITAYKDFSNTDRTEPYVRYINRWHLDPSNPDAPLSPPKKPIVFWIENAVPLEYRDAIREGILMWNKAFEKAGFQNAIEVRQMPDNADWNPADVRYNTIRWFNSLDAFFAKAPVRVNPLNGEILDADIVVDANMVLSLKQEYRALMDANQLIANGLTNNSCHSEWQLSKDNDSCYGREAYLQAEMGHLAMSLLLTEPATSDGIKQYIHQYLRSLIAHEVGHALGLRHNFHGSTMLSPAELNNIEITRTKGLVSSVMDYLPVNLAPPGMPQGEYFPSAIGPYDEWAIEYGYKVSSDSTLETIIPEAEIPFLQEIALESLQPELAYATDEDIFDINPDANIWDMSSDVLLYSQWQMDNARLMWQRLDKRYPLPGESYSELRSLFDRILIYYFRNANLITKYIGGQSFQRNHAVDVNSWAFVPVNLAKQREALATLEKYVFAEDAFTFSPQLLNRLAPSRWRHWGNPVPVSRLDYPIHERILTIQKSILRSLFSGDRLQRLLDIEFKTPATQALTIPELFDTLLASIWTEVLEDKQLKRISTLRRSLQREHLDILLEMVLRDRNDVPSDGGTLAWYELRQLQKVLDRSLQKRNPKLDLYTIAHLEETSDRIHKALNAQLRSM